MSDIPITDKTTEEEVSLMTDDQLATVVRRSYRYGRTIGIIIGTIAGLLLAAGFAVIAAFT